MRVRGIALSRRFARGPHLVLALDAVSVEAGSGRLTLLQGPSGSGKTTLINLLSGLDRPSAGRVLIGERDLTGLRERERDELRRTQMGFVFQGVALIAVMSALENVEFGLRVAGLDASARAARAEECLALVGLAERLGHRPGELSGGEQQRVAIARGFAHRPALLFVDEPTAELDVETGKQAFATIRRIVDTESTTVVMSSHDPHASAYADVVVRLMDGRVRPAEEQA